jgi:hypothetical protein
MITKKELRIGNLVEVTYKGEDFEEKKGITRVIGVSEEGTLGDGYYIELEALEEYFENVRCSPIPLTEEILLKCGFEHETMYIVKNLYLKDYGDFYFVLDENNGYYHVKLSNHGFEHEKQVGLGIIKHLHQLQNLYFALTNQELEIKL